MSCNVTAAGALIWMTHTILQEHGWMLQGTEIDARRLCLLESYAGDVNFLQTVRYKLSKEAVDDSIVHMRALLVGSKVFTHFVSSARSVNLRFRISEFVKPREPEEEQQKYAVYIDKWRCNLEFLRWRLERTLFSNFVGGGSLVASDAELSRLPDLLLRQISGFLNVFDFSRFIQTNKYLHHLSGSSAQWQSFLQRDFLSLQIRNNPKALYISNWTHQRRLEAWDDNDVERRFCGHLLRHPFQWHNRSGGLLINPPLNFSMAPPFLPLEDYPWSLRRFDGAEWVTMDSASIISLK
ncbi:hypothetical protein CCR75_004101 [Bremia lactucae]|uniref:F-box domain-containing protein n=1 Tax=Bremia lactucae TaxID=4779 RepID=A0A976IDD1_BRELC|nr:hypothetical protein CCR75_004101 [Bremia lactucae]